MIPFGGDKWKSKDTFACRLYKLEVDAHNAKVAIIRDRLERQAATNRQAQREDECERVGGHAYIGLLNGAVTYRCEVCGRTIRQDGLRYEHMSVPEFVDDPDAKKFRPVLWPEHCERLSY